MAAFWHISLPYQIVIEDKESSIAYMEANYPHFQFERINEYETQSPALPNGKRLTFQRKDRIYQLPDALLQKEYKALYHDFIAAFQEQYVKANSLYSSAFRTSLITDFLAEFDGLEFTQFDKTYEAALKDLENNYFVEVDTVANMYVYEGYPIPSDYRSHINTVSLLRSYEKMNVIAKETVTFFNFCDWAKTNLSSKYKIAPYLFVVGY